MAMLKFLMKFDYSNASWARMLAVTDDRTSAVTALLKPNQPLTMFSVAFW
jgi:hypothetical protein